MELTESIKTINRQLIDLYGIDTVSGNPMWKVVWSEDQFEKRMTDCTDKGIILSKPEVRLLPKYRQWIKERYVLERLTIIPEINSSDLPTQKLSYEPTWVFETQLGQYLPPYLDGCKLIIDSIYAALGKKLLPRYKDPDSNPEEARENYKTKITKLSDELFGNETETGDALAYKQGIVVPSNYISDKES